MHAAQSSILYACCVYALAENGDAAILLLVHVVDHGLSGACGNLIQIVGA